MSAPRWASTIVTGLLLFAAVAGAEDWSTNLPSFNGGSYDGWDRDAMTEAKGLGGALVTLSSGTDQTFAWTEADPAIAMLTIHVEDPMGVITNGVTMRVRVPTDWACRFDAGVSVAYGGNAVGKVSAATFSADGRELEIPLTADFAAEDTLTISGLSLLDLAKSRAGAQRLELDFTGDGALDVYDDYQISVTVGWAGGSYDGWDSDAMADAKNLMPAFKGILFQFVESLIEPERVDTLEDGNTIVILAEGIR